MRFALCQINPTIGAMKANAQKIVDFCAQAQAQGADFVITPELSVCGYPPKDLLFRPEFTAQVNEAVSFIARNTKIPLLIGAPIATGLKTGAPFYNAAIFCYNGKIDIVARKTLLPNYDIFDENRFFEPWTPACGANIFSFGELRIGVSICEDAWNFAKFTPSRNYREDPIQRLADGKADIIINMAASPFVSKKPHFREQMLRQLAQRHQIPFIMTNQIGAHDQLIFDGTSLALTKTGKVAARLASFVEEISLVTFEDTKDFSPGVITPADDELHMLEQALVLGIRDYTSKCGAQGLIIGLSGGVDSALTAALACQAIGAQNILGVRLPSAFSSPHSLADAAELAANLNIEMRTLKIEPTVETLRAILNEAELGDTQSWDLADQNIQSRARGVLLMGLSNLTGKLLLTTGNKSELAVGYTTLYGDMCGALAPIADLYKTDVWRLASHINRVKELIPSSTINKAPSAELKANQSDQDTLPDYKELDRVLEMYINKGVSLEKIRTISSLDHSTIDWIINSLHKTEYKRWQAAPCLIVSEKAFGQGRKWPIAQQFNEF